MLTSLRPLLHHERTVAQWLALAARILVPYVIIGSLWAATHTQRFGPLHGIDLLVSAVGSVVLWPALLFAGLRGA